MKKFTIGTVIVGFIALVAGIFALTIGGNVIATASGWHKESASKNAVNYIREMQMDAKGFSCGNQDTDGDGYVSCSFNMNDGSRVNLECAGWSLVGTSGCRDKNKMNFWGR